MPKPFMNREIDVYTCLTDRTRKPIAMIRGFNMVFRAPTPLKAKKAADDWRREAVKNDKLLTAEQKALFLGEPVK